MTVHSDSDGHSLFWGRPTEKSGPTDGEENGKERYLGYPQKEIERLGLRCKTVESEDILGRGENLGVFSDSYQLAYGVSPFFHGMCACWT